LATPDLETVVLELGSRRLALPLPQVVGALQMVALDALPSAPVHCKGAFDYHGQLVAVVDLARRLGLPASDVPEYQRALVVVRCEGGLIALAVDRVLGVGRAQLPAPSYLPTQPVTREMLRGFMDYRGARLPVLDAGALLRDSRSELRALLATQDAQDPHLV
jgi:chemotaxis signal transduction protein